MPEVWQAAAGGREVSQGELEEVAQELLAAAGSSCVWLFFGEMGSGKTTLIKAIGRKVGVMEGMSSPTFSIVNEYQAGSKKKVYHFDLYRLTNEKEVFEIGAEEYFESKELCLVEWGEKLGSFTPAHHLKVRIIPSGPRHRKIEYQKA